MLPCFPQVLEAAALLFEGLLDTQVLDVSRSMVMLQQKLMWKCSLPVMLILFNAPFPLWEGKRQVCIRRRSHLGLALGSQDPRSTRRNFRINNSDFQLSRCLTFSISSSKICALLVIPFLMRRIYNELTMLCASLCYYLFFPQVILFSNSGNVMKVLVMWRRWVKKRIEKGC